MHIVLNRVDDRLIHGQVFVSWVKKLSVKHILVLDDNLATDNFMKSVLSMAALSEVTVEILSVADGARRVVHQNNGSAPNTILLFKSPKSVLAMYKAGYQMKTLNIGCMNAGLSRRRIFNDVFASDEEVEIFRELIGAGVDVYIQMVSAETKVSMADLLAK